MGEIADRLDAIAVEARSPDGRLVATIAHRKIHVAFAPGAYRSYGEPQLAHQLAQLATLAWTRWHRARQQIINVAFETPITDDAIEFGTERRRYRQGLGQIVVEGASDDGLVVLRATGLLRWQVHIADGTLRQMDEKLFVRKLSMAVADAIGRHQVEVTRLKDEIYGLGIPGLRLPKPPR